MSSMAGANPFMSGMNATGSRSANSLSSTGSMGNKVPRGYKSGQLQQFTPEQMQLFQQMFGQLGPESFLGKLAGGDESMFGELEAPALKQFSGLQGNLASRFSGAGMGARRSSGFQNTTNQAASDFAEQLRSQRMGLRNQALQDLMGLSNQLLGQRPYEQFLTPKQKPWWQEFLGSIGGGAGQALGGSASIGGLSKLGFMGQNAQSQVPEEKSWWQRLFG